MAFWCLPISDQCQTLVSLISVIQALMIYFPTHELKAPMTRKKITLKLSKIDLHCVKHQCLVQDCQLR